MKAKEIILETMRDCLPDGTPLSFTEITSAAFQGKNRIVAGVVMFDGEPATLVLSRWAHGWSHTFENLPGGDVSFEEGRWMRIDRDTLLPIAMTGTLATKRLPNARTAEAKASSTSSHPPQEQRTSTMTVERIARVIALSYGQDPDDFASLLDICGPNNEPLPIWQIYKEQAEAVVADLGQAAQPFAWTSLAGAKAIAEGREAFMFPANGDTAHLIPLYTIQPVQDTWFADRALPVMAMSADVESNRVLKLYFRRPVTDDDRKALCDALNMHQAALKSSGASA